MVRQATLTRLIEVQSLVSEPGERKEENGKRTNMEDVEWKTC